MATKLAEIAKKTTADTAMVIVRDQDEGPAKSLLLFASGDDADEIVRYLEAREARKQ